MSASNNKLLEKIVSFNSFDLSGSMKKTRLRPKANTKK